MKKCMMKYKTFVAEVELFSVYELMLDSKALSSVFYDGSCQSFSAFLEMFSQPDMHYWLLYYEGQLCGIAWMNGMVNKRAFAHFCMLKNVYGRRSDGMSKSVAIGRFCLASWLNHKGDDGQYLIDVLVGITPERNKMAIKWVQRVGFVRAGTIPFAVWMGDSGESEPGVLSYATRETVDPSWVDY
jgi:hypothetical protein